MKDLEFFNELKRYKEKMDNGRVQTMVEITNIVSVLDNDVIVEFDIIRDIVSEMNIPELESINGEYNNYRLNSKWKVNNNGISLRCFLSEESNYYIEINWIKSEDDYKFYNYFQLARSSFRSSTLSDIPVIKEMTNVELENLKNQISASLDDITNVKEYLKENILYIIKGAAK